MLVPVPWLGPSAQVVVQNPPFVVLKEAGMAEWEKMLLSAAVGAVAAVLGNIVMEYVKLAMSRRSVESQLTDELVQNYGRVRSALNLLKRDPRDDAPSYDATVNLAYYILWEIRMDQFQFYYAGSRGVVFGIDPKKHLVDFNELLQRRVERPNPQLPLKELRLILGLALLNADCFLAAKKRKYLHKPHHLEEAAMAKEAPSSAPPESSSEGIG